LSLNKAEYIRDLAKHFASARLDPREWPALDDEALIEALVDVKGIGRWTAEMFLMFHELRADVLPVGDIGLQKAVGQLYFDGRRPTLAELRTLAEGWQPYRSVATWYLWRSLDPIPVEY
jgi:DNA-3-methyladenine glycosylase II